MLMKDPPPPNFLQLAHGFHPTIEGACAKCEKLLPDLMFEYAGKVGGDSYFADYDVWNHDCAEGW